MKNIIMKNIIVLVIGIFNFCELLYSMEKNVVQKPYYITVYSADKQRMLVPLNIMRESNVLYEQYCKKVSEKQERLFLNAPINHTDLSFFVDACKQKEEVFKERYCVMPEHKKTTLMDIACALKSSWAKVRMFDCYYLPQDIQDSIIAMAMPIKDAAESLRYCKIRLNMARERYFCTLASLSSDVLVLPKDQWGIVYKGDGRYYKAPLGVIHDDTACWDGECMYKDGKISCSHKIKIGEKIYSLEDDNHYYKKHLTIKQNDEKTILHDDINEYVKCVFSNDGQWLVTGSYAGPYEIVYYPLDIKKTKVVHSCGDKQINAVCFNHQSTLLAIGFACNKDNLVLQRVPDNKETVLLTKNIDGHKKGVWDIQFSGDDKRLLTASTDGRVILWDISNVDNIVKIKELQKIENKYIGRILFNNHGDRIVIITEWKYILYDGYTGEVISWQLNNNQSISFYGIVFSTDDKFFLTMAVSDNIYKKGYFRLWDTQSGNPIAYLIDHYSTGVGFFPDLRYIIDTPVAEQSRIYITELYNDQDEKEIEQIADYKPKNLCDAYAMWRACKAAENGDAYLDGLKSDEIKKIIAASVIKK